MNGMMLKAVLACAPFAVLLASGCVVKSEHAEGGQAAGIQAGVDQSEAERFKGVWEAVREEEGAVKTTLFSELRITGSGAFSLEVKRVAVLNARDVLEEHLLHVSGTLEEISPVKGGTALRFKAISKDFDGMNLLFTAVESNDGAALIRLSSIQGTQSKGSEELAQWIKSMIDGSVFKRL